MSAAIAPLRRPATPWLVAAFVVAASVLLMSRAWVTPLAEADRVVAGAMLFSAILVGATIVPAARSTKHVPVVVTLGVGVVALAFAAVVSGTPVPMPTAAWTVPLSLLAAVAEEALFRRVAFSELERWSVGLAIVGSALLFAAIHVPLYGVAAFPVDLGAGLVFGWQRWASGSWASPAATHAIANLVAVLR